MQIECDEWFSQKIDPWITEIHSISLKLSENSATSLQISAHICWKFPQNFDEKFNEIHQFSVLGDEPQVRASSAWNDWGHATIPAPSDSHPSRPGPPPRSIDAIRIFCFRAAQKAIFSNQVKNTFLPLFTVRELSDKNWRKPIRKTPSKCGEGGRNFRDTHF